MGRRDERSSLVYVSELYVLIADLRKKTKEQYVTERSAATHKTWLKVEELTPPPSVADDHEQMMRIIFQSADYPGLSERRAPGHRSRTRPLLRRHVRFPRYTCGRAHARVRSLGRTHPHEDLRAPVR